METLTIQFQNELSFHEIPYFRGAMLHSLPDDENQLLHNHIDEGFRYAYPLIQYKSINGKAAIVCLNEGIDPVMQLMKQPSLSVRIGRKAPQDLCIEEILPVALEPIIKNVFYTYHIHHWISLNKENYARYVSIPRITDRILFLEKILTGNILSFLKGIGIHLEDALECHLLDVEKTSVTVKKGTRMVAFNACFQTNIELPDYIGLGKHTSVGCGVIKKVTL